MDCGFEDGIDRERDFFGVKSVFRIGLVFEVRSADECPRPWARGYGGYVGENAWVGGQCGAMWRHSSLLATRNGVNAGFRVAPIIRLAQYGWRNAQNGPKSSTMWKKRRNA